VRPPWRGLPTIRAENGGNTIGHRQHLQSLFCGLRLLGRISEFWRVGPPARTNSVVNRRVRSGPLAALRRMPRTGVQRHPTRLAIGPLRTLRLTLRGIRPAGTPRRTGAAAPDTTTPGKCEPNQGAGIQPLTFAGSAKRNSHGKRPKLGDAPVCVGHGDFLWRIAPGFPTLRRNRGDSAPGQERDST